MMIWFVKYLSDRIYKHEQMIIKTGNPVDIDHYEYSLPRDDKSCDFIENNEVINSRCAIKDDYDKFCPNPPKTIRIICLEKLEKNDIYKAEPIIIKAGKFLNKDSYEYSVPRDDKSCDFIENSIEINSRCAIIGNYSEICPNPSKNIIIICLEKLENSYIYKHEQRIIKTGNPGDIDHYEYSLPRDDKSCDFIENSIEINSRCVIIGNYSEICPNPLLDSGLTTLNSEALLVEKNKQNFILRDRDDEVCKNLDISGVAIGRYCPDVWISDDGPLLELDSTPSIGIEKNQAYTGYQPDRTLFITAPLASMLVLGFGYLVIRVFKKTKRVITQGQQAVIDRESNTGGENYYTCEEEVPEQVAVEANDESSTLKVIDNEQKATQASNRDYSQEANRSTQESLYEVTLETQLSDNSDIINFESQGPVTPKPVSKSSGGNPFTPPSREDQDDRSTQPGSRRASLESNLSGYLGTINPRAQFRANQPKTGDSPMGSKRKETNKDVKRSAKSEITPVQQSSIGSYNPISSASSENNQLRPESSFPSSSEPLADRSASDAVPARVYPQLAPPGVSGALNSDRGRDAQFSEEQLAASASQQPPEPAVAPDHAGLTPTHFAESSTPLETESPAIETADRSVEPEPEPLISREANSPRRAEASATPSLASIAKIQDSDSGSDQETNPAPTATDRDAHLSQEAEPQTTSTPVAEPTPTASAAAPASQQAPVQESVPDLAGLTQNMAAADSSTPLGTGSLSTVNSVIRAKCLQLDAFISRYNK
jgi:hypothetical protein